jgi:hypothetical protein
MVLPTMCHPQTMCLTICVWMSLGKMLRIEYCSLVIIISFMILQQKILCIYLFEKWFVRNKQFIATSNSNRAVEYSFLSHNANCISNSKVNFWTNPRCVSLHKGSCHCVKEGYWIKSWKVEFLVFANFYICFSHKKLGLGYAKFYTLEYSV